MEQSNNREKHLETLRVRNIACISTQCAVAELHTESPRPSFARLLIVSYMSNKGYSPIEISSASTVGRDKIEENLIKYNALKEKYEGFRRLEANFLKKMDICCART